MSGEFHRALEFIERAEGAGTLKELQAVVAATLEALGVPKFSMFSLASGGGARAPQTLLRQSEGWGEYYWESGFYNVDAAVHRAMRRERPFSWSELEGGRLPKASRNLFGEIRGAMRIRGGFNIPIHDGSGFAGLIGLYHEDAELAPRTIQALKLISMYAITRARELHTPAPPEPCPLTNRQREIIAFVAGGKSDWDISQILQIADRTVNEHVELAKKTLGVRTRMQAVAIAVRHGWIAI
ncbi:MAG: autoinducer binding domain-containing protein [Hyphomonadaceae bacterium]|nr:autoinducer binding domain-containing protein [Hyphomonadaceae bacterium]